MKIFRKSIFTCALFLLATNLHANNINQELQNQCGAIDRCTQEKVGEDCLCRVIVAENAHDPKIQSLYEKKFISIEPKNYSLLATLYREGNQVKKNPQKVKEFLKTGCLKGNDPFACNTIVELYFVDSKTGYFTDKNKVYKLFSQGCKNKSGFSCFWVGRFHDNQGRGVWGQKYDEKLATNYYKKSCDYQEAFGCGQLAAKYIAKNKVVDSEKYASMACKQKSATGCYILGKIYYAKQYKKQNYAKAYNFFKQACELEEEYSCGMLGYMHKEGVGTSKDSSLSKMYFKKACKLGANELCDISSK